MASSRAELPEEEEEIYSYFNKSVSAVQIHADQFEEDYARPALRASQIFFDERPIAATFVAIFVVLSAVPIAAFLALSLFAVALFTIFALTSTIILCGSVVLSLLSLLILTLLITLASSTFLTLSGICIYAFASLLSHLRRHGASGVPLWLDQMSELVFGAQRFPTGALRISPYPPNDERDEYFSEHTHTPRSEAKETDWASTEEPIDQHDFESRGEDEEPESPCSAYDTLPLRVSEKNENGDVVDVSG